MSGFTKLASSIVTSSVWVQDDHVLRVWIAMLATSDANGVVEASIPGFANLCRISIEQMEDAIAKLSDVDTYSRSPDFDGRRIEKIEGGWLIINYAKYRATRDPEERKRQVREAVARHRAKVNEVIQGKPPKAQAEAEAEAEKKTTYAGLQPAPKPPNCPKDEIVNLYHEFLPMCPRVQKWTDARERLLRARWREHPALDLWKQYFAIVKRSKFLTGKANGHGERPPFLADFEWLIKPGNFVKVLEGRYDDVRKVS